MHFLVVFGHHQPCQVVLKDLAFEIGYGLQAIEIFFGIGILEHHRSPFIIGIRDGKGVRRAANQKTIF